MPNYQTEIESVSKELTGLIYDGDVAALGVVIILRSTALARTMSRAEDGFRFHLIAGTAHLQHDLLHAGEIVGAPDSSDDA